MLYEYMIAKDDDVTSWTLCADCASDMEGEIVDKSELEDGDEQECEMCGATD